MREDQILKDAARSAPESVAREKKPRRLAQVNLRSWWDPPLLRVLIILSAILLFLVLTAGISASFIGRAQSAPASAFVSPPPTQDSAGFDIVHFRGIGSLRLRSADKTPSLLALSIVLAIPAADGPFREELWSRKAELRRICFEHLGSKTAAELSPAFEGGLKAQLRDRLNAVLLLGKVADVIFPEYQLID